MAFSATKSERVGLIVRAINFQDFNLCGPIHQRYGQTDRQTDRRHATVIP